MSHNVRIVTKLQKREVLKRSLDDLHIQYEEKKTGFRFDLPQALQAVGAKGYRVPYERGATFIESADTYSLSYDSYARLAAEHVLDSVSQRYAYNVIKDEINTDMAAKGFSISEEVRQDSGAIKITVTRWS